MKKLDCSTNLLTEINVSQNTELLELWCYGNQITSLDVSNNAKLDALYCHRNLIGELDVSENIHLTRLDCSTNELTEIDISLNTGLKDFLCHKNQLTELDVSKNTLLENLWCNDNHLSALDLTGFSSFNYFDGKNQTVYLTLYGTNNNYSTAISLNNPTKLASGITYSDGILTSNSSAISSSPFAVETELDRHNLSGTFFFTYLHCEEWSDWTINKEPTCEEPGIKTRTRICSGIVETDWEIIPALGGDWGEWSEWTEVLPTCTEPGYRTRTRTDRTCGNIDTETEVLPALGHDWGDWKTIKEPDCEEEGIMERICLRNPAHKETVSIPKLTDCGKKDNGKFIIVKNPVYDKAEMFVILPEDETLTELRIVIFDAVGNIVFENKTTNNSSDNPMIWDLRNQEERLVSSGTYLVVAEAKSVEITTSDNKKHRYSAKLMVKK